jgi:hypothetical protein
MKSNLWTIGGLLAVLLLGIAIGHHWDNRAQAQVPDKPQLSVLRYQISAYGGPTANASVHHGCYLVDTRTGQVWHTLAGGKTQEVSPAMR